MRHARLVIAARPADAAPVYLAAVDVGPTPRPPFFGPPLAFVHDRIATSLCGRARYPRMPERWNIASIDWYARLAHAAWPPARHRAVRWFVAAGARLATTDCDWQRAHCR